MELSGQNPKVQSRRSAIRSEGIDCLNASPSSSSAGSKIGLDAVSVDGIGAVALD